MLGPGSPPGPSFLIISNVLIALAQLYDQLEFAEMLSKTFPLGGNVINLSIDHRAVGGDAHIAPRGMVSFWYHTAANS